MSKRASWADLTEDPVANGILLPRFFERGFLYVNPPSLPIPTPLGKQEEEQNENEQEPEVARLQIGHFKALLKGPKKQKRNRRLLEEAKGFNLSKKFKLVGLLGM